MDKERIWELCRLENEARLLPMWCICFLGSRRLNPVTLGDAGASLRVTTSIAGAACQPLAARGPGAFYRGRPAVVAGTPATAGLTGMGAYLRWKENRYTQPTPGRQASGPYPEGQCATPPTHRRAMAQLVPLVVRTANALIEGGSADYCYCMSSRFPYTGAYTVSVSTPLPWGA